MSTSMLHPMNDGGKMREGFSSTPPATPNDVAAGASAPSAVADSKSSDHKSRPLSKDEMIDDSKQSVEMQQDLEQPDRGSFPTEEEDIITQRDEDQDERSVTRATNVRTSTSTKLNGDGGPDVVDHITYTTAGEENVGGKANAQPQGTIRPASNDILFGRGKPFQNHPGNRKLILLVDKYKEQYVKSVRDKKRPIVEEIISILTQDGARFLKRYDGDSSSPFWVEASKEVAFDKVSHAFRSRGKSKSNSSNMNAGSTTRTKGKVNTRNQQMHNPPPPQPGNPPRYGMILPPTVSFGMAGPAGTSIPGATTGFGMIGVGGMPLGPFFNPWTMNMLMNPTATAAQETLNSGYTDGARTDVDFPPIGTATTAVTNNQFTATATPTANRPGVVLPPGFPPCAHGMLQPPPFQYMQHMTSPQPQLQYYRHHRGHQQQQQQQYQPPSFGFVQLPQQAQQSLGQEQQDKSVSTTNKRPPSA